MFHLRHTFMIAESYSKEINFINALYFKKDVENFLYIEYYNDNFE